MTSAPPSSMRACQWTVNSGGLEHNLKVNDQAPLPKNSTSLASGQTLVKVAYSSLNPFDYKVAEVPIIGNYVLPKPAVPCLDYSGTVISTTLPHLAPGDAVFGRTEPPHFGCLAEYIVVGKQGICPLPSGVSLRDAATAGTAALAAYISIIPYVKPGSEIFVNGGSGGTGTFGIQFAKAVGCRVTATCSGRNVGVVKDLGADEVVDYERTDVLEWLKGQERKFDLVVDNVFSRRDLYWECRHYLKPEGTFVTPGDAKLGALRDTVLAFILPSWLGGGGRKFVFTRNEAKPETLEQIGKWMQEGKVKTIIEEEYSMENAGEAFVRLKTGRVRGKLIVRVGGQAKA